jgi:hypothetical protein
MAKNTKKLTKQQKILAWLNSPPAGQFFMVACGTILLCTVLFWSMLTVDIHQFNADQLMDSYLFENTRTFMGAVFPGAHTFMLKWPIFALMQVFGAGLNVFMVTTVLLVLATVGFLVYVLYCIESRPYVFGVLCLSLASVLLLVPAQPYPGALLPVNMAMTTTRNIEYVAFVAVLWYAVRIPKLKSWPTLAVGASLAILTASDKLFAVLAFGGCAFAVLWYGLVLRRRAEAVVALGWTLLVIVAVGAATVLLSAVNGLHATEISNGDVATPFALVRSAKDVAIGSMYAFGALLTNFGANPVHGVTVLKDIPTALNRALGRPSILAYAVNAGLFGIGIYATARLFAHYYRSADTVDVASLKWLRLSVLLVGATLVAAAVYVLTDHYYPVDARYLTISLFALTVAAATYFRGRDLRLRTLGVVALVIVAVIPLGVRQGMHEYLGSQRAMVARTRMTARVSEELGRRDVKRLVGDYWDVTPVKAAMAIPLTVAPVDSCTQPRPVLNSKAWFDVLPNTPTAFLAVRDGSPEAGPDSLQSHRGNQETYDGCTLQKVVGTYGVPTERVRIDSSINPGNGMPDAMLLIYPEGVKTPEQAAKERQSAVKPSAPVRKTLTSLRSMADCSSGTSLQVVAHQDDDLLFMNPDVLTSIQAGRCMRSVYVTAGNAGEGVEYWGGREHGVKDAYAEMFGVASNWTDEVQYIGDHKVTVSYLKDEPKVSLVFLRLPDGNIYGEGFAGNNHASLHHLLHGSLAKLRAVDDSGEYTKQDLVDMLLAIMNSDQVDEIRTLGSANQLDGDHADHHDVGILTAEAADNYTTNHSLTHYLGYPERELPENLPDDMVTAKQNIFLIYAKSDGAVCQTVYECNRARWRSSYAEVCKTS